MGPAVPIALQKIAQRLLPFPKGNFSASGKQILPKLITERVLMVAVEAVAEAAGKPSASIGRPEYRLLGWVRGSSQRHAGCVCHSTRRRLS